MNIAEITARLKDNGVEIAPHTLRRRIDTYLVYPSRNHRNNRRDLDKTEFNRLLIGLAIESKGKSQEDVVMLLDGKIAKTELMGLVIDSNKVDMILRKWIEE